MKQLGFNYPEMVNRSFTEAVCGQNLIFFPWKREYVYSHLTAQKLSQLSVETYFSTRDADKKKRLVFNEF